MTPDSQSSANPAQKSDNQWELILPEFFGVASNWNRAEKWVKRAELVDQRVVAPSINELRYAGRRVMDAFDCAGAKDFDKARDHLKEANENIYKASHDAIDTVIGFIGREIKRYVSDLGHANLNDHFGRYQELLGLFNRIRRQVENSRENRYRRDEFYRDIVEGADFENLQNCFDELRSSVPAILASIAKKKRETRNLRLISAASLAVGITGIALFVIFNVL